jgi:Putative rhamnosyl transferase
MQSKTVARFVLMRFNVEFPGFEHLDNTDPVWLDYRLRLADLTSFHSLRQQSLRDFKLVLLIDSATPASFIDALRGATQGLDVILFEAENAHPRNMSSTLLQSAGKDCQAIQTSRLDSDDMYHPDFLRDIDACCAENAILADRPRYFRYLHGQDYVTHSAKYSRITYPENAFGTLIEPASDSLLTVFCDHHKRMSKRFVSYLLEEDTPMWCRIHHGSNLLNKPRRPLPLTGHLPVHPALADFGKRPTVHPQPKHEPPPDQPPR